MKIAILYICTGKYDIFWEGFYQSSEHYFLTEHEKHYFIFTDSASIKAENEKIHIIYQENLGWPYNTLLRFQFFLKAQEVLKKFDYIYFLNSNMRFLKPVGEEVFPSEEEDGLLGVLHPSFFNKESKYFTYDRNKKSLAYIPKGKGKYYFMGGFNGGKAINYLRLINELKRNIDDDLSRNVIALWHDESHLNAYLLNKNNRVLSPSYGFPEGGNLPFEAKIIILDKNKFGGNHFLRITKLSKTEKILPLLRFVKKKVKQFLSIFIIHYRSGN
jgi:hypothetical protein